MRVPVEWKTEIKYVVSLSDTSSLHNECNKGIGRYSNHNHKLDLIQGTDCITIQI